MSDKYTPIPVTTSYAFGSAFPAYGFPIGGTDGTNMRGISVDSTGKLQVVTVSGGTGKFYSTGTANLPTGVTSTTALNSTDITTGKTGTLLEVVVASSVPVKWILSTNSNGTLVTVTTGFILAGTMKEIDIPSGTVTLAGGTNHNWEIDFLNMDPTNSDAAYGSFFWTES